MSSVRVLAFSKGVRELSISTDTTNVVCCNAFYALDKRPKSNVYTREGSQTDLAISVAELMMNLVFFFVVRRR